MQTYDAIVIGSGIGGLACASLLTKLAGKRVLVLERHFKAGGQTHEFERKGPNHKKYAWDVGLHYVGEMEPGQGQRHLLDAITGDSVDWIPLPDPYDVFLYPGFRFDVPFGEARYRERLQARFPSQAKAIERYFGDVHEAIAWMEMQMARKAMPRWMALVSKVFGANREALALSTTKAYLDEHFSDPLLRSVLASQWGDYGLTPAESSFGVHALAVGSFFKGAYYPDGGAQTLAKGALGVVEAGGGACLVNRDVRELILEDGRVVGVVAVHRRGEHEEREEHRAPVVVSDIGARATYLNLVPESVELPFDRDALRDFRHGHSAVCLYLGLSKSPRAIGLEGANYWIFTDTDHEQMCARAGETLEGRPPSAFVSFPSARDPHAETHTATVIVTVDYEAFAAWADSGWKHRSDEYEALKRTIADGILALVERELPGLRELVEYVEVSTPLTMQHFTGRSFGTFYGLPATPEKFRQPWSEIQTPLPGLLLTGTDVACLGIVGAAMGGLFTVAKLLGGREFGHVMAQVSSAE